MCVYIKKLNCLVLAGWDFWENAGLRNFLLANGDKYRLQSRVSGREVIERNGFSGGDQFFLGVRKEF